MARHQDDTIKLVFRLPPALHRRLSRVAARNNQSLNSEMIRRLEQSFELDAAMAPVTVWTTSATRGEIAATTADYVALQGYRDRKKLVEVRESLDRIIAALWPEESKGGTK